jgi:hypothetical protein
VFACLFVCWVQGSPFVEDLSDAIAIIPLFDTPFSEVRRASAGLCRASAGRTVAPTQRATRAHFINYQATFTVQQTPRNMHGALRGAAHATSHVRAHAACGQVPQRCK